jgi:hypothetical protein
LISFGIVGAGFEDRDVACDINGLVLFAVISAKAMATKP